MDKSVPFAEGSYIVERAILIAPDGSGVALKDALIEVFSDPNGNRVMQGRGFVRNLALVKLLETQERVDLLLDLGEGFKYLLERPTIQAGKVFEPKVESVLHFAPASPIIRLSEEEFNLRCANVVLKE